jgi:hypothetical protein
VETRRLFVEDETTADTWMIVGQRGTVVRQRGTVVGLRGTVHTFTGGTALLPGTCLVSTRERIPRNMSVIGARNT